MKPLRVLVVEDSMTVRKRLCEILSTDPNIIVVAEAQNGKEAIELCMELRPDVISIDMMMPILTGLAAVEYIMAYCPTPILVVSSSFNRGEVFKTYEALAAGAVEMMEKPTEEHMEGEWERHYIATLKLVSRVKVVTHLRAKMGFPIELASEHSVPEPFRPLPLRKKNSISLVAIGASTGGPAALVKVLRELPEDFSLPIVIVIHIGEPFGKSFADWLDTQTHHKVRLGEEGQLLNKPGVFVAPANRHMIVQDRRIRITDGPERHSCRPSVDILFESVAADFGSRAAACLLTGMGQDGAQGLRAIRNAGGMTIAQDEASCVVYGMPREAALLGAAERILPLPEIGLALAEL